MNGRKLLGVMIDSEGHTDLSMICNDSINKVRDWMEKYGGGERYASNIEWNGTRCDITDGDYFMVGEIFAVPDNAKYVVLKWHAYDGVDFEVISATDNEEEAFAAWYGEVSTLVSSIGYYDEWKDRDLSIEDIEMDGDFCGDNGNEWDMVRVIQL